MELKEIKLNELFEIDILSKNSDNKKNTLFVTKDTLNNFYLGYMLNYENVLIKDKLTLHEVKKLTDKLKLYIKSSRSGRCWCKVNYLIESEIKLNEKELSILRGLGCFVNGQEWGKLISEKQENDLFIYELRSERDSSD